MMLALLLISLFINWILKNEGEIKIEVYSMC